MLNINIEEMFNTGSNPSIQDYFQDIDQLINNKISLGMKNCMKMVIKKIVSLIEERVTIKVKEELTPPLTQINSDMSDFNKQINKLK